MQDSQEAGELLWKYVQELKRTEKDEGVNFVVWTAADPANVAALLPLADAVGECFAADTADPVDDTGARAALNRAIRAEGAAGALQNAKRQLPVRPLRPVRMAAMALGLAALVVVVSFAVNRTRPQPVVTLHVRSMIQDHEEFVENPEKPGIRSSDARIVAAGISREIGHPVRPIDLTLAGTTLFGGRRCLLDGQPIAFWMFRAGGVPLSLYELRAPRCRLPGMAPQSADGRRYLGGTDGRYNVLAWRDDSSLYVAVSTLSPDRLHEIARHASPSAAAGGAGDSL